MEKQTFLLRGDKNNPYHLSIGQVVINDNNIALIKKSNGVITLPRETAFLTESQEETLIRGAQEEVGVVIEPIRFIGSLITSFNRDPKTVVEKSTLYFLTKVVKYTKRNLKQDELDDTVLWVERNEAIDMLNKQNNPEAKIVIRVLG